MPRRFVVTPPAHISSGVSVGPSRAKSGRRPVTAQAFLGLAGFRRQIASSFVGMDPGLRPVRRGIPGVRRLTRCSWRLHAAGRGFSPPHQPR